MDEEASGVVLLVASLIVEGAILGSFFPYPEASRQAMLMVAALVVIPALVVGYFVGRLGFIYGIVLGIMPAILGLTALPTAFLGLSRVEGAVVLFFAYVLASGFSGAAGQLAAKGRNAA
jgi:hypothetical protein